MDGVVVTGNIGVAAPEKLLFICVTPERLFTLNRQGVAFSNFSILPLQNAGFNCQTFRTLIRYALAFYQVFC